MVLGVVMDYCVSQGWIDEEQWATHWPDSFKIRIGVKGHVQGVNDRFFGQLDALADAGIRVGDSG